MENLIKTTGIVSLFVVSGFALAECPNSLSADDMYDCIVVEGAGGTYKPRQERTQPEAVQAKKPAEKNPDQQAKAQQQDSPF